MREIESLAGVEGIRSGRVVMRVLSPQGARVVLGLIVLCALVYSGGWLWLAGRIDSTARERLEEWGRTPGLEIGLRHLSVSGFPGPPVLRFSGSVRDARTHIDVPQATLRGFFLPGTALRLEFPEGYTVQTSADVPRSLVDLRLVHLEIVLPFHFPPDLTGNSLREWQARGESLPVRAARLERRDGVRVDGAGTLGLDSALQPDLRAQITVTRWGLLVDDLREHGRLTAGQETVARALLGALSGPDGVLRTGISLANGGFFLGPVRLGSVPPVAWPNREAPDRH
ncbi:MAG TPA: DUF2125 domain-containing protein, partial [Alphaproteobacteria bacterium]|nr:DUF2125 domain-containing protein [Alphaproteobacteria bacterium]